jgi:hypothetical protein
MYNPWSREPQFSTDGRSPHHILNIGRGLTLKATIIPQERSLDEAEGPLFSLVARQEDPLDKGIVIFRARVPILGFALTGGMAG